MTVEISDRNFENLVREGIQAARSGRIEFARRTLLQATRINPYDARPWVWLSETTADNDERREYLERAVAADPGNATARRGLAILGGMLDPKAILPQGQGVPPLDPEIPLEASGQVYDCPQCGGRQGFDPRFARLTCEYCGHTIEREFGSSAGELLLDLVLPTSKAHRWAEAAHLLVCQKCGANTVIGAGEKSAACPYCGSNQVIESEETRELIEPQEIGLMSVARDQIPGIVNPWFKQGWFTPDDLLHSKKQLEVRPAYYPVWAFSGTLEAAWSCEVREGTSQSSFWVPKSGTEHLIFDGVLVPGVTAIPDRILEALKPFNMDQLIPYASDQLAGWAALAYDRSMADASLLAREKFVKEARVILSRRVNVGNERRDFKVGGGKWSGMTSKLMLLPLWVGTYRYKGTDYPFIINGQTGKVAGAKPKDDLKRILIWTAGIGTILLIGLISLLVLLFFTGNF